MLQKKKGQCIGRSLTLNHKREEAQFSEPDAYCVVCEQTGDDHFERDKASRIKQLDEWLKNGLIDANEYRELKERYLHNR